MFQISVVYGCRDFTGFTDLEIVVIDKTFKDSVRVWVFVCRGRKRYN